MLNKKQCMLPFKSGLKKHLAAVGPSRSAKWHNDNVSRTTKSTTSRKSSIDAWVSACESSSESPASEDFVLVVAPPNDKRIDTTKSQQNPPPASLLTIPECFSRCIPRIYKAPLRPLDLRFGFVRETGRSTNVLRASRQVIREAHVNSPQAKASVCFVVKRPGCVLCFEQGAALSELMNEFAENSVAAWAVVKEINTDNEGLLSLYQNYFRFPFFRDEQLALYSALGDRRIPSLFKIARRYFGAKKRLKTKGIEGSMIGKGEGMILGGVVIFDRNGCVQYVHQEKFAKELPVDEIRAALRSLVM